MKQNTSLELKVSKERKKKVISEKGAKINVIVAWSNEGRHMDFIQYGTLLDSICEKFDKNTHIIIYIIKNMGSIHRLVSIEDKNNLDEIVSLITECSKRVKRTRVLENTPLRENMINMESKIRDFANETQTANKSTDLIYKFSDFESFTINFFERKMEENGKKANKIELKQINFKSANTAVDEVTFSGMYNSAYFLNCTQEQVERERRKTEGLNKKKANKSNKEKKEKKENNKNTEEDEEII